MKQVFIMQMKGTVVPRGAKRSAEEDWLFFEGMMKAHFKNLDCQVNEEIIYLGEHERQMAAADLVVYCHERRKEIAADLFHKQMHLKKLFTLDHLGWGADHSNMMHQPDFERVNKMDAIDFCKQRRHHFLTKGESKFVQPSMNNDLVFPESFFFFPLQRPNDATIRNHAPKSEMEIMNIAAAWGERKQQHIVFKLHPSNHLDPEIIEEANRLAQKYTYIHLLEGNVHDFINRSKGVMVINSGVGFESLIHGKPVMNFGNCDYKWVTLNINEDNLDEAIDYAKDYSEAQRDRAWQFIYYYFFEHAYSIEPEYVEASRERLFAYLNKVVKITELA